MSALNVNRITLFVEVVGEVANGPDQERLSVCIGISLLRSG